MNKTEILNIVNEPSKHIQIVKIDGKDSIVYSSKFVELLELIPTMLTKADMIVMLEDLLMEMETLNVNKLGENDIDKCSNIYIGVNCCKRILASKINKLKGEEDD